MMMVFREKERKSELYCGAVVVYTLFLSEGHDCSCSRAEIEVRAGINVWRMSAISFSFFACERVWIMFQAEFLLCFVHLKNGTGARYNSNGVLYFFVPR